MCSTNSWRVYERNNEHHLELADIFREYGPPTWKSTASACRHVTARSWKRLSLVAPKPALPQARELGGEVFLCEPCQEYRYSYHSCQDRHCPKCGNDKADEWLAMQSALLLPVTYFMLTITLPDTINAVARSNQAFIYSLFFQTAAAALQKLARDPKLVGGQLGFFGVLQTWARDLAYHPHLHFIVAGGGLSPDGMTWLPVRGKFLVPVKALSKIFRAKFRVALKKKPELFNQLPPETLRA